MRWTPTDIAYIIATLISLLGLVLFGTGHIL